MCVRAPCVGKGTRAAWRMDGAGETGDRRTGEKGRVHSRDVEAPRGPANSFLGCSFPCTLPLASHSRAPGSHTLFLRAHAAPATVPLILCFPFLGPWFHQSSVLPILSIAIRSKLKTLFPTPCALFT